MPSHSDARLQAPILIVEDEPLMQQRLATILQSLGCDGQSILVAGNVKQGLARLKQTPLSMMLVDLGLPDGSGVDLVRKLRNDDADVHILVVSAWSAEEAVLSALRAGATGYILKERDDLEIAFSIRSVLRGGAPIDPFVAKRILELLPVERAAVDAERARDIGLSKRETGILQLVAEGLTNREIAEQLFISRYTVECHLKRIYKKLAVSSRTGAVNEARQHGLLR